MFPQLLQKRKNPQDCVTDIEIFPLCQYVVIFLSQSEYSENRVFLSAVSRLFLHPHLKEIELELQIGTALPH